MKWKKIGGISPLLGLHGRRERGPFLKRRKRRGLTPLQKLKGRRMHSALQELERRCGHGFLLKGERRRVKEIEGRRWFGPLLEHKRKRAVDFKYVCVKCLRIPRTWGVRTN